MFTRLILLPLCCSLLLLLISGKTVADPTLSQTQANLIERLVKQADQHITQSQYEQALELLDRAYQHGTQTGDSTGQHDVLSALANVYYHPGQLEQD